jgi:hypothetical protein
LDKQKSGNFDSAGDEGKILLRIGREVTANLRVIKRWKKGGSDSLQLATIGAWMSDQVWNSFSDGGELHWIKDHLVSASLAETYAPIKPLRALSEAYLSNLQSGDSSKLQKTILADLTRTMEDVEIALLGAYKGIGRDLNIAPEEELDEFLDSI